MPAPKVLLVDDEERVLAALTRELMEQDFCEVIKAQNAEKGLELLRTTPDIFVVCSDFHMPGMDGVSFLAQTQESHPNISRILLTGAANLNTAIEAVNRGKIFRFLLKPCPSDMFLDSINAGIRQYQLITAEQDLLSKTLNASLKIMMDILAALNPEMFNQSTRLRSLARWLAEACHVEQLWEVELAAMLSQIGAVTIPPDVLNAWNSGNALNEAEQRMIDSIPHMGYQLVRNIPRLENIAVAIEQQDCPYCGRPESLVGESIPVAARIIKIVLDYDRLWLKTKNAGWIFENLAKHSEYYDPFFLEVFRQELMVMPTGEPGKYYKKRTGKLNTVHIEELQPGMVLAKDIFDRNGLLIISKGTILTDVLKYRLIYFFWNQPLYNSKMIDVIEEVK